LIAIVSLHFDLVIDYRWLARRAAINSPLFGQTTVDGLAVTTMHVLPDKAVPLIGINRATLRRPWIVSRAASKLPGPLAKPGLDVPEGSVPVHRGGSRRCLAKVDALMIT
jgi:hypothetical protein